MRHAERHTGGGQVPLDRLEMLPALGAEIVDRMGQRVDDRLIRGHLAIEDAERVGLRAPLAVAAQLRHVLAERIHERLGEGRPADVVTDGVDHQLDVANLQLADERERKVDDLGVDRGILHPEDLDVELVELPVAPLLGPLVPEHRADGVELRGRQRLLQIVLDEGTDHARRRLGPERHAIPALVDEGVHLLLNDVGRLPGAL